MYLCPACKKHLPINSFNTVRIHLNVHKKNCRLDFPVPCSQGVCKSSFTEIRHLIKHLNKYHQDLIASSYDYPQPEPMDEDDADVPLPEDHVNDPFEVQNDDVDDDRDVPVVSLSFEEITNNLQECLKDEIFEMLLAFRSKGSVTFATSLHVVEVISTLFDILMDNVIEAVKTLFTAATDVAEIPMLLEKLKTVFEGIKKIPMNYDSEAKIRSLYGKHPLFVPPESLVISQRFDVCPLPDKPSASRKYNCAQYVPIKKTVRSLLRVEEYAAVILKEYMSQGNSPGEYSCYQDGSRYKTLLIKLGEGKKPFILFQVYFDGMQVTNPLSPSSSIHSTGMFYFSILNVPPETSSSNASMFLIAACNSLDLKNDDGVNSIFDYITEEIAEFETNGVECDVAGLGTVRVYGTLAQFTADNLGLNQMFGLIECFSTDYCCALCYATREELQNQFKESQFTLRNRQEYARDCTELSESDSHVRGVKSYCKLNDLQYFHTTENWINDVMHTVFQGIIPHVMSSVVHSLWKDGYITLNYFNDRLRHIFGILFVEKKNKPCEINGFLPPGRGFSPKFHASQMWALFRYMPLMLSTIQIKEKYWDLFLLLQEIVDITMAPRLDEVTLNYFEITYEEFLTMFKRVYPNVSVIPKMHFLVHLPTIVRKNGPLKHSWAMGFERLNGTIKKPSHIINNFRNPQKTLAYRQQCSTLSALLGKELTRKVVTATRSQFFDLDELGNATWIDIVRSKINPDSEGVELSEKVKVNSTEYRKGSFVLLSPSGQPQGFIFGKIICIVRDDPQTPLLVLSLHETLFFDQNTFSHRVVQTVPSQTQVCTIPELLDYHPLDGVTVNGHLYIRMKYLVY